MHLYPPSRDQFELRQDFTLVVSLTARVLLGTGVLALVYTRRHSDRRGRST